MPATRFDAYATWLQIPGDRRPPNHYDLLGLPTLESDVERISAAGLERIALVRKYQLGQHAADAIRLLGELSAAFDTLTTPERKQAYDRGLQSLTTNSERAATETRAEQVAAAAPLSPLPVAKPLPTSPPRPAPPSVAGSDLPPPSPLANLPSISIQAGGTAASASVRTRRSKQQSSRGMLFAAGGIVLLVVAAVAYSRNGSKGNAGPVVQSPHPAKQQTVVPAKPLAATNGPVPHVIQPSPPIAAKPTTPSDLLKPPAPAKPAAAPTWVPLFITADELSGTSPLKWVNGSWEVGNGARRNYSQVARDAIVRARVTKLPGQNVSLTLRASSTGYYSAWFNGGNWFGVGKGMSGKYIDIKHGRSKRNFAGEFEFKFAVVGDKLTVWADGEVVVQGVDRTHTEGSPGFGVTNGRGLFRDVEIQVLDTPLSLQTEP